MIVHSSIADFKAFRCDLKTKIGFVPTMGALHEGHLSLIRKSKSENEKTCCSIFVNPIQFNNPEDFAKYPKVLDRDLELLQQEGCDVVFVPSAQEMYPIAPKTRFDFGSLETVMEGAFRPGHFNGVAIVVSKLFHIVRPNMAYFGRKDLQQTLVIKQLVSDLQFPLEIEVCDTWRESDGLAMSSRNARLTTEQRTQAVILYQQLLEAKSLLIKGMSIPFICDAMLNRINAQIGVKAEYFQIVEANSLLPFKNKPQGEVAICVAAYFGDVRLIDNLVFPFEGSTN